MDILDWWQETPFDIEAKNHKSVAIKEWMRQAKAGASLSRIPTVVFQTEDDVLACLPFEDLVDLAVQIRDLTAELKTLRSPVPTQSSLEAAVATKKATGVLVCRNGHIVAPGSSKCLIKGCPYSSTYKPKKEKK
ncbi:hypothetical protein ACFU44_13830 [Nocardia rhizosphaerihabitans]|uniref:hypothetical protein n=1 Tax=Nocardia rhizosphaerihabitans TaxID=1691570 RepID=UPI003672E821